MDTMVKKIKYYLYRLQWKLGFLTHIDVELNNTCDHACIMCWHSEKLKFNKKRMSYFDADDYLFEGRSVGARSVKFNLRGEPTLHPDLETLVQRAKYYGYTDIMINSHGTRMYKHFIPLRDAGITTIILSVGNMDKQGYMDLHQVPGSEYDNLHKSLKHIHDNQGDVIIKLNCHESETSHFDWDRLRKEYPNFKIVKRYIEKREGKDISIKRKKIRKRMCPHLKRRLTIHSNGKFYPCCMSFNEQDDICLGDNFNDALAERKKMIKEYKKKQFRPSCVECPSGDVWKFKKI